MFTQLTVDNLYDILQQMKADGLGGYKVKVYSGDDYENPSDAVDDGFMYAVHNAYVNRTIHYVNKSNNQQSSDDETVYFTISTI